MKLPKTGDLTTEDCLRDLKVFAAKGQSLGSQADGSVELAFMRGYQAGYEQAVADDKAGTDAPLALYTLELPTLKQLGKGLRARMKLCDLGMRAVAKATGVSTATVCRAAQAKEITATHYRALVRWLAD